MYDSLRIRQLDTKIRPLQAEFLREVPNGGWIRLIRTALGMSMRQLADRAGVAKNSVAQAEDSEVRSAIQLDTLQAMADAMDCDLVYALVPRTSLHATLRRQAYKKASRLLARVSDSMALEGQAVSETEYKHQLNDIAEELMCTRGRDFWND
ncbi:MAG: mobile mystery protein A [Rhodothermales bacterium]|jgi:predicted DNA-binding mobile mystery protein A